MLNEKSSKTEKVIHLLVTSLCKRDCKYCCNKQYDLNDVPYVTKEELRNCNTLCITGGEPFAFTNPDDIAFYYRQKYSNIKKVYVYTNAVELVWYLAHHYNYDVLWSIDGINVSIKTEADRKAFKSLVNHPALNRLTDNRLYVFDNLFPEEVGDFEVVERVWQPEFVPADDSIFRKV